LDIKNGSQLREPPTNEKPKTNKESALKVKIFSIFAK